MKKKINTILISLKIKVINKTMNKKIILLSPHDILIFHITLDNLLASPTIDLFPSLIKKKEMYKFRTRHVMYINAYAY